jgi:Uma2 family endonuclease
MVMPAQDTIWTAQMARDLPDDGNRYEVLDGVLVVSPSPTRLHQRAVSLLLDSLRPYCRRHGIGEALPSPADIELSPSDRVQPDVFVVPNVGHSWEEARSPLLAVEVLSPSTARIDRGDKRTAYQRHRVPEYWVVDLDARLVEVWCPDDVRPGIMLDVLTWRPREHVEPLTLRLPEYFQEVHGSPAEP